MGYKDSLLAKSNWDQVYFIVPLWQGGQVYKSTYFPLYDYHATNSSIDSRFHHKLWSLYDRKNVIFESSLLFIK